jgi:hypothetical protein
MAFFDTCQLPEQRRLVRVDLEAAEFGVQKGRVGLVPEVVQPQGRSRV